ncbi:MAG: D-alanine--D-alanine ligase family protein [Candidatus Binatia bacterium]
MTRPNRKVHVGIIFGGRSGEHQISLRSARCIVDAIDRESYALSLIGIDRQGHWHLLDEPAFRRLTDAPLAVLDGVNSGIMLVPAPTRGELVDREKPATAMATVDVVFPVLHGPYGEDGTVQGLLELADIPYVGAGVLGSALGMDKDVQKRLLQSAGLPVVPFVTASARQWATAASATLALAATLGVPLFVKPANLGSSVGITKVKAVDDLPAAIEAALAYDTKVLIEKGVDAREIECAVLGNDAPQVSVPGEIRPAADFYSYEAKYIDSAGAALIIPAPLTAAQTAAVQALALRVFRMLDCAGMARVDFFLDRGTGDWYVNELNSIPGFTTISMYPKLWEASGIPYRDLIGRLIDLALDRHAQRRRLRTAYTPAAVPTV